jgi:glycerol kinase
LTTGEQNTKSNQPLTLVIDQGTLSTRALAIDENGKVLTSASRDVSLQNRGLELVEQDANEIVASVHEVVQTVLGNSRVRRLGVSCAGLATQRSSVVAWDKRTGEPLGPLLSWQDRRAAEWLSGLNPHADQIKEHTGLPLSPHYGASKLRWYLDHLPAVKQAMHDGSLAFGPLASFLLFHLLEDQPLVVDHANASRTQLWNLQSRDWDPWLLDLFGIPLETLPLCQSICHNYGILRTADIPMTAVNGDQTSAIYSLGRPRLDTATVNIGTGGFVLIPTGPDIIRQPALLSGLARSTKDSGEYIIEGTVNGAGAALEWAAKKWDLPNITTHLSTWLLSEDEPPVFINTIGGLGSPWWQSGPSPTVLGDGEPWQRAVAVAESILFMLQANLETMGEAGLTVSRVQISGGLARFDGLCQRLASLAQLPVYRPAETEATCRGIAWLAAGSPSRWPKPGRGRVFKPQPNLALDNRYRKFRQILG